MQQELVIYGIKNQLLERSYSVVPGLGVFMLKKYPARIDLKREIIHPPGYSIDFFNAPSISDYLIAWQLANNFGRDFNFWFGQLEAIAKSVRNGNQGEYYELEGLGRFKCGNEPVFELSGKNLSWLNGGLPIVKCPPVKSLPPIQSLTVPSSINTTTTNTTPATKPTTENSKETAKKTNWRFILLLLLLASLLFGLIHFFANRTDAPKDSIIPPYVTEERLNQKPDMLPVDSSELDSIEEKTEDEYLYRDYNDFNYQDEELDEVIEEEGQRQDLELDLERAPDESERYNRSPFQRERDIEENAREIPESTSPEISQGEEKCIIITGAFSRMRNVNEMTNKLQAAGYAVYTENIGSLTRVGAVIPCTPAEFEFHFSYIRSNIESGSWLLE